MLESRMALGVGVLARNNKGECLAWRTKCSANSSNPVLAKLLRLGRLSISSSRRLAMSDP
ncbi:UNVERIFIED_CONTAM: hypothetical protein Sradi_3142800 [Sesamum radiatum]|uniref:Uncharacterized protein n=1 Tax=Sesamum radiatum TaxID=300843 RepID=A0AAW2REG8_SESRA